MFLKRDLVEVKEERDSHLKTLRISFRNTKYMLDNKDISASVRQEILDRISAKPYSEYLASTSIVSTELDQVIEVF